MMTFKVLISPMAVEAFGAEQAGEAVDRELDYLDANPRPGRYHQVRHRVIMCNPGEKPRPAEMAIFFDRKKMKAIVYEGDEAPTGAGLEGYRLSDSDWNKIKAEFSN